MNAEQVSVAIRAVAELNKMQGDLAPTKNANINVNVNAKDIDKADAVMQRLLEENKRDY